MQAAGYVNLCHTTDSRRVLDLYSSFEPDLILLDLLMPYLDGFGLMEQIKGIDQEFSVPIVVLTALSDRETRLRALEAGARDFIVKPFDKVEVLSRIHNIVAAQLLQNALFD